MTKNGTFSHIVIPAKAGIQEKDDFFNGLLAGQRRRWMVPDSSRWKCFAFVPETGKTVPKDPEEIPDCIRQGIVFWLDIEAPTPEDAQWLKRVFDFHDLALSDLLNNGTRPKQESYGDVLFTVFGAVNLNPGEEVLDTINLNLFLTAAFIVTTHCKPIGTIQSVSQIAESQAGLFSKGTDYVYYMLLDGVVDRYFDVIDEIEDEIDELEKRVFDNPARDIQEKIFETKRKITYARRTIGPKRDALRDLVYAEFPQIKHETRTHLRDVLDHVLRINDALESHRELLNGLMESYMTQISNRMNEVMKQLTIIATIMLPLTFLTGLFGMNFDRIPGLHWEFGFWFLLLVMGAIAVATFWFFRRKRIL